MDSFAMHNIGGSCKLLLKYLQVAVMWSNVKKKFNRCENFGKTLYKVIKKEY